MDAELGFGAPQVPHTRQRQRRYVRSQLGAGHDCVSQHCGWTCGPPGLESLNGARCELGVGSRSGGRRETGGKSHSLLYHRLIARQKIRFGGVQGPPGVYEKPRKNIDCRIHKGFAEQRDPGVYGKSQRKHTEMYTPAKLSRAQF